MTVHKSIYTFRSKPCTQLSLPRSSDRDSTHGLTFRPHFPGYCRGSILAVCRGAAHPYQEIKWYSATWETAPGPRAPRAFVWPSNPYADLFQGPSPPHYKDIDDIEREEEH